MSGKGGTARSPEQEMDCPVKGQRVKRPQWGMRFAYSIELAKRYACLGNPFVDRWVLKKREGIKIRSLFAAKNEPPCRGFADFEFSIRAIPKALFLTSWANSAADWPVRTSGRTLSSS